MYIYMCMHIGHYCISILSILCECVGVLYLGFFRSILVPYIVPPYFQTMLSPFNSICVYGICVYVWIFGVFFFFVHFVGGHLDVTRLLIENKAEVDSQDNRKVSCLMAAFRKVTTITLSFTVDSHCNVVHVFPIL